MPWAAIAAIGEFVTALVVVAGVIYTAGKLTQKLQDHEKRFDAHDERFKAIDAWREDTGETLQGVRIDVVKLQEWRRGYESAANVQRHHEKHLSAGTKP
jgi:hypothetical protein